MEHPRILLIEDEAGIRLTVGDRLASEGYVVEFADNGDLGFSMAGSGNYAALILDAMLPGKSGFDIARDLRASHITIPILMLTARSGLVDRVLGLKMGADDYLPKPFEMIELLARLEALLRRAGNRSEPEAPENDSCVLGDVVIDHRKAMVFRAGLEVQLTAKEFALLSCFARHRGSLLTRERLLNEVWGYEKDVSTRTVDVHVASLRHKIELNPEKPRHILTVRGMGYRLSDRTGTRP